MLDPLSMQKNRPKILIVEDDELVAIFIQLKLELFGYQTVGQTNNGEEAIKLAGQLNPDLILMDIQLSGNMDGITAAEEIRTQHALPVVFLTGIRSDEEVERATKVHAFGYIIKPFSDQELRAVIEMALYKHHAESKLQISDLALKAISQGVIITSPNQTIISVNEAFSQQTGYTAEDVVGKSCRLLQGAATNPQTIKAIAFAIRHCQPYFGEILNYRKDQSTFWNELTITPALDEQGQLTHFIGITRDITERKNTLEAMRQSEHDLLEAERATHVGHWVWESSTGKITWSEEMKRIWQRDPNEYDGDIFEMIRRTVVPEDQATVISTCKDAFENREDYAPFEYRIFLPDSSIRSIWAKTGRKQKDPNGKITRLTGTVQDITERKKAEEERRLNDARMEQAFGSSPIGMALIDVHGRFFRVNRVLCNMFGYDENELLDHDWREFSHKDDLYTDKHMVKQLLNGEIERYEVHKRYFHKEGGTIWLQINVSVVRDVFGMPINFVTQIQDITQRLIAEAHLNQLSQAVEQSTEAIIITDVIGKIEYVNDTFVRKTGYSKEEIIGKYPNVLNSGVTQEGQFEALWRTIRAGETWKGELINRRKDGSHATEHATISPLRRADGTITHFVSTQEDITEKKKLAEELNQHRHHLEELVESRTQELAVARKLAEAANLAKSNFIANMSHEIRTPMNGVLGMTYLALATATDPKQRDYLQKIHLSGQHLLHIVDDILDFSKIEAGKMNIEGVDFSLEGLMAKLSAIMNTKVAGRRLSLSITIDPDVPRQMHGDPHRINQILINYTNNAIKFTEQGEIKIRISTASVTPSGWLIRFEVADSGIGMSEQQQARLFQSFEQADSSITRKYGGTGLGLAISKQIAALMGGEVGVHSQLGVGSSFWFTALLEQTKGLPLEHNSPAPSINSLARLKRLNQTGRAICVLIADDNEFNQQVGSELLEAAKFRVLVAGDGQQAINILLEEQVDCILMDIQMPVMDGMAATRQIRMLPAYSRLPIIAITANAMHEDRIHCLAAGMNDFIPKPFAPEVLYSTILRWVSDNAEDAIGATDDAEKYSEGHEAPQESHISTMDKMHTPQTEPNIDLAILAKLVGDTPEKIGKFALKFLDSAKRSMIEIRDTRAANNLPGLCALGHRLKSSARTVGALQFGDICHELEALRETGSLEDADLLIEQLKPLLIKIEAEITVYLNPDHASSADILKLPVSPNLQQEPEQIVVEAKELYIPIKPNLHVVVLEDDHIDMEIVCLNLRKFGITSISPCTDDHQAMAVVRT